MKILARNLSLGWLAAVFLLTAAPSRAQDLDAGKTPQQVFSSNCTACHRNAQGLAKGRGAGALASFLSQHYTTSRGMASALAGYVASIPPPAEPARSARAQQKQTAARGTTPPAAVPPQTAEKPLTPAERRKEREARRLAMEERAARVRGVQRAGEIVTVDGDPDPVRVSSEGGPLLHERALSQSQSERSLAASATAAELTPQVLAARAAAAVSPPAAAAVPPQPASLPAASAADPSPAQPAALAATTTSGGAPAGGAVSETGAPALRGAVSVSPAEGMAAETPGADTPAPAAPPIEDQVFSTPLP